MTSVSELSPGTWTVDPSHTEVGFVARHLMVSKVRGRFSEFEATITVGDERARTPRCRPPSRWPAIDTATTTATPTCASADFFDADELPEMTFASTGIRRRQRLLLDGDLTIRGVTRRWTFDLEFNGVGPTRGAAPDAGFSAETEINRKDFGLEWNVALEAGGVLVGEKVKIVLEVEARQGLTPTASAPRPRPRRGRGLSALHCRVLTRVGGRAARRRSAQLRGDLERRSRSG